METLKKQRRELVDKKKALYTEYRQAQQDMRQAVAVKANIDHLLGLTDCCLRLRSCSAAILAAAADSGG